MFSRLKRQWRQLRADPSGERFRRRYERRKQERRSPLGRTAWTLAAIVLIGAGVVAIPLPGPGALLVVLGLAILAEESRTVATVCDRADAGLHKLLRRLIPRRRSARRGS
jgi:hypothetical protein